MIFAGGFSAYWDVPYSIFLRKKNQFDLLVSGFSLLFLVFAVLQHLFDTPQGQDAYGPAAFLGWPGRDHGLEAWNRITLALPSLRLFSAIGKIRVIWVCLAAILPRYSHVFTLWFVFMYGFGCVGCWLLAGRFRHLDESVYDMPQANFNSMLDSVTSLFQLFIGEAWNGVKQAAVDTRGGFIEAFFLVYILSMTVIFVNLMSGAPQTPTSKKQLPFACASPVPHQQLISAAFSALIQRRMPARPGVIVSSWEVVAKVKEAERKWHNLSVWQFEQLASHQDMDKSNLVVQFERTKSRGKEEREEEKDERWKDKTAWSICVVSARRPFLVLALPCASGCLRSTFCCRATSDSS